MTSKRRAKRKEKRAGYVTEAPYKEKQKRAEKRMRKLSEKTSKTKKRA